MRAEETLFAFTSKTATLKGRAVDPAALALELDMEEKIISCIYCGKQFALTAPQQERLRAAGFTEPKWCKECRKKKAKIGLSRHEVKLQYKRKQSGFHPEQHSQY